MAQQQNQPGKPTTIKARCLLNYGNAVPGAIVEVSEQEYHRLREMDKEGGFRYPVLISQADSDALEAKKREADRAARAARDASDTDRATADGWAEYQRKSSEVLAAARIKEQERTQALLLGKPLPAEDPEEVKRKFAENVSAGRG